MALTYRATFIMSARHGRAPILQTPVNDSGRATVADVARYQTIGSLQALALAATAALVTTALIRLVL
ncbi:hypothetical protein ACFQE0_04205 [Methylobacterium komagatae]|uniref:Uncharacterized protein n=1 Tax=Methylobacterium komagatae TaxID=374425 RepID=A0ABW2BGJ2_9HYPH